MILMPTMVIDDDAFEWVPESVEQEMGQAGQELELVDQGRFLGSSGAGVRALFVGAGSTGAGCVAQFKLMVVALINSILQSTREGKMEIPLEKRIPLARS